MWVKDKLSLLKLLLDSINKILKYTEDFTLNDLEKDEKTFDACLM